MLPMVKVPGREVSTWRRAAGYQGGSRRGLVRSSRCTSMATLIPCSASWRTGTSGGGTAPHQGHGQPHLFSRGERAFGADDDPRNLVIGTLRLGTAGGAREGPALIVGLLQVLSPGRVKPTLAPRLHPGA